MSPVTVAGTLAQVLAEVLSGAATTQLVRPGAPVLFGVFASSMSMQSGAPTFGTPEPSLVSFAAGQLARRLGIPFRTGGSLCGSKIADAQAAYESAQTLNCRRCSPAPTSCCMRPAGSRAAWRQAMRSSSWTRTSSA